MELIELGYIVSTHGIKGELKVKLLTDFPYERFAPGSKITLYEGQKEVETVTVKSFRFQNEIMILSLEGYDNINDVKHLTKKLIMDSVENILEEKPLDLDEYYYFQLLNLNAQDQFGNDIGFVENIKDFPQGAIMVINHNGTKSLVPFNAMFVEKVNLEENKIVINVIDGLLKG